MAKYFITYGNSMFELAKKRIEQEAINLNIFDKIILYSEKDISDEDLVLREGDRLIVPQYDGTVKINGAVMFANTVAYVKGKRASYYIDEAGGFASDAVKSKAYVIYMNGKVAKVSQGARIQPGCEIIVPSKLKRKMSVAETMSLGSSMSSIAAMIATIANMTK